MSFLYPFLDESERDAGPLLADLARSAAGKAEQSARLKTLVLERCDEQLDRVAQEIAGRLRAGGRIFAFGNGGSATDAAGLAALFSRPPVGRPLPARSLVADEAVLTALANDIGFDVVYSRQLIAHGRAGDVAVGLSTSGNSANVIAAFEEASRRGLLTVGVAGYEGGAFARSPAVAHCLVVPSDSVHRIQEAQNRLVHALWQRVHIALGTARPETAQQETVQQEVRRQEVR
jgi:D-sedoheptulose 7-phosphate isomerase